MRRKTGHVTRTPPTRPWPACPTRMPRRLPRDRASAEPRSWRRSPQHHSKIVQSTLVHSALFPFLDFILRENAVPLLVLAAFAARSAFAPRVRYQRRQRVIRRYIAKRAICLRCCAQHAHLQIESTVAIMLENAVARKYRMYLRRTNQDRQPRSGTWMVHPALESRIAQFNNRSCGLAPALEGRMGAAPQRIQGSTACPKILRRCRRCERETPHEVHSVDGMNVTVCVCCVERALLYELDRD